MRRGLRYARASSGICSSASYSISDGGMRQKARGTAGLRHDWRRVMAVQRTRFLIAFRRQPQESRECGRSSAAAIASMPGTMPTVETVTCRHPSPPMSSWAMRRMDSITLVEVVHGSPPEIRGGSPSPASGRHGTVRRFRFERRFRLESRFRARTEIAAHRIRFVTRRTRRRRSGAVAGIRNRLDSAAARQAEQEFRQRRRNSIGGRFPWRCVGAINIDQVLLEAAGRRANECGRADPSAA